MNNSLLNKIVNDLESGEMEKLQESIIPFFKTHKNDFLKFIEQFQETHGKKPLEFLIKYFILSSNMPFSMKLYMEDQSKKIISDISKDEYDPEDKNKKISKWIHNKAANYRSHSILRQIICFDKVKSTLIPLIRKELDLPDQV